MNINIHEPLEVIDKEHPEEIFNRDILKRNQLAERILSRLREEDCPRALGIYGGWGTGKTSLLNLMRQLNTHASGGIPSPIYMVSIDAWEHESGEGLLIPVVAVLDELKGADVKIRDLTVVVKRALFASGMVFAGAMLKKYTDVELKELQGGMSDAALHDGSAHKTILDKWKKQSREIKETKDAFAALVDSVCRKQGVNKLAICIDNLDRCSPENVVRLLESVKVFFNVSGCVWVFAVDSEVIASYVDHKYAGTKMDGNSYLDKIIPEQYHLSLSPSMDRVNIVQWLQSVVNFRLDLNERKIPQLPRVLVPRRLIKSAAKLAEFKRRSREGLSFSDATLFNLALLYHVWPDFYQRFSSASEEHVRKVLEHFFPSPTSVPIPELLPWLNDYVEDNDLSYFMTTVFNDYPNSKNPFVREITNSFIGLREVGLP